METKISISLNDLKRMLDQQKEIVIDTLLGQTYTYNKESIDGELKSMQNIDKDKFRKLGSQARYPDDFNVLKKFLT